MHRLSAYVIVHRTRTDWVANAIQSDGGQNPIGRRTQTVGGAAVSAAPTKQTEQELHQQSLQISFHEPQPDPRPARYHAPRNHEQPIAPIDGHYLPAALHRIHDVRSHMLR